MVIDYKIYFGFFNWYSTPPVLGVLFIVNDFSYLFKVFLKYLDWVSFNAETSFDGVDFLAILASLTLNLGSLKF